MKIRYSPCVSFDEKNFTYVFDGEKIEVAFDGVSEIFDFEGFPDGEMDSSLVETVLKHNPIISAKKVDGILSVELLNFISEDATEEEKFPEWIEV